MSTNNIITLLEINQNTTFESLNNNLMKYSADFFSLTLALLAGYFAKCNFENLHISTQCRSNTGIYRKLHKPAIL